MGTDLGPLHSCDSCGAWFSCGTHNSWSRAVLGSFAGICELLLKLGQLTQTKYKGTCLVLLKPDIPYCLISMGGLLLSEWKWKKSGLGRGKREVGGGTGGREGGGTVVRMQNK